MVSVTPSLPPIVGGNPTAQAAPSVEEKLALQPSLTLLVFILLPCVVLLFLINCFLLFHRLPVLPLKKKGKRRGGVSRGNNPACRNNSTGPNNRPEPGGPDKSTYDSYCAAVSQGLEATLALGESAHASVDRLQTTREWCHKQNETPVRPFYLRPPHAPSVSCCPTGSPAMSQDRRIIWNEVEDGGGGGGRISYSELESAQNAAPPNTPAALQILPGMMTPQVKYCNKTSTQRKTLGAPFTPLGSVLFDHASSIPPDDTPTRSSGNSSFLGPGLDSDFGVSLCTSYPQTVTPARSPGPLGWNGITMTPVI
ncbi:protein huluwa-like isoform X2 [Dendropsophus ebraccatus]|uniref:protein huluwa-like isoform X2 n=1 Tax=Dendropsophus ebraccatus TaxID=150705 RepID=UPI0038321C53